MIRSCLTVLLVLTATAMGEVTGADRELDPSTTLWYAQPAGDWQTQALPVGNGRLGAMIFGGIGRERIALNEDSVWSGARVEWNRPDASANLPKIRELLLAGQNPEAEALVNQTFTCIGGGSRGGARGPWGCFQELGNLHIARTAKVPSIPLARWKLKKLLAPKEGDRGRIHAEIRRQVEEAAGVEADDSGWEDYVIEAGKAIRGERMLQNDDKVLLRHRVTLTTEQAAELGVLRIDPWTRNGSVYVNGQKAGELVGWQGVGHEWFSKDVSHLLKPGENVIVIYCTKYRNRGELPYSVQLEPKESVESYRRSLDLTTAVSRVRYTLDGVSYLREAFASAPDQVMVFRFTADQPGKISFTATLDRLTEVQTTADGEAGLVMTGQTSSGRDDIPGMRFVARLRALHTGGRVSVKDNSLVVDEANEAVLLVAAGTDYQGFAGRNTPDPLQATTDDINRALRKSYTQLLDAHLADHRGYFDRVSLSLTDDDARSLVAAAMPTDQRHAELAKGNPDPALAALYFNYGRYLLISSSRPGTMPANLQGLWAEGIQTPWNCDYHLDINVQMNYWPAEVAGLGDCHTPLFKLIESLQEPGAKTAKAYYNADGWVAHVITNVWGFTAPGESASWGATATGSPWLCDHLWEHYDYNRDLDFLKWAYPIMKGSALFFLDMLITDPKTGYLVTAPSNSPENAFTMADGRTARVCMGPTMDNQILRELFRNCIEASQDLAIDEEFREQLKDTLAKLPPNKIGKHGQIMEWLEDYDEPEPTHRHVSPLYGLHPHDEITPEDTPELAQAARVTLQRRGDRSTGWSMAWKSNFWARLHDGDHAHQLLRMLIGGGGSNLLCQHAPFQIDGNFGGTAAIAEMLLQSHNDLIRLLPALPDAWPHGKITGFRARGGYALDLDWKSGKLVQATVHALAKTDRPIRLRYEGRTLSINLRQGQSRILTAKDFEPQP